MCTLRVRLRVVLEQGVWAGQEPGCSRVGLGFGLGLGLGLCGVVELGTGGLSVAPDRGSAIRVATVIVIETRIGKCLWRVGVGMRKHR